MDRLFSLLPRIGIFFSVVVLLFAQEEAGLARAALLPSTDRGRRRTKHYITAAGEEGSDGT